MNRALISAIGVTAAAVVSAVAISQFGGATGSASTSVNGIPVLDKPNVVLIVTDDQTKEEIKLGMPKTYGRSDWVRFTNTSANVALCCPARTSLLTGQFSHHHGIEDLEGSAFHANGIENNALPVWLKNAGYTTGIYGKYLNGWSRTPGSKVDTFFTPPGWDQFQVFPKAAYTDWTLYANGTVQNFPGGANGVRPDNYSTDVLAKRARGFIRNNAQSPFFLYFAPYSSHSPNTPADRHKGAFANTPMPKSPAFDKLPTNAPSWMQNDPLIANPLGAKAKAAIDTNRRKAAETALAADEAVTGLFDELTAQGVADNTIVIFIVDNGYSWGDHRWLPKRCQFDQCTQLEMYMRVPGVAGGDVTKPVSNVDVAATIADLTNATPTLQLDGRSFAPLAYRVPDPKWRRGVLTHWHGGGAMGDDDDKYVPEFWAFRTPEMKYIEYPATGEVEMYDLANDPWELNNVAGTAAYATQQADLAQRLTFWKTRSSKDLEARPTLEDYVGVG